MFFWINTKIKEFSVLLEENIGTGRTSLLYWNFYQLWECYCQQGTDFSWKIIFFRVSWAIIGMNTFLLIEYSWRCFAWFYSVNYDYLVIERLFMLGICKQGDKKDHFGLSMRKTAIDMVAEIRISHSMTSYNRSISQSTKFFKLTCMHSFKILHIIYD